MKILKVKKIILLAFLLTFFGLKIVHATCSGSSPNWTATSCEEGDIQDCIKVASEGDTVNVPAGTCTWTTTLIINKGIHLKGAGDNYPIPGSGTLLIDNVATANYTQEVLIKLNNLGSTPIEISDFEFTKAPTNTYEVSLIWISGNEKVGWKIHDIYFHEDRADNHLFAHGYSKGARYGVIYNCRFVGTGNAIYLNPPSDQDEEWATPTYLGKMTDAVTIEDCYFEAGAQDDYLSCMDGEFGANLIFRNNYIVDGTFTAHGAEQYRSTKRSEVYGNTFIRTKIFSQPTISLRGGSGIVYNNMMTGKHGWEKIHVTDYCARENCADNSPCKQEACTEYPCKDQIGRMYGTYIKGDPNSQYLEPIYFWNNLYRETEANNYVNVDCLEWCNTVPCQTCLDILGGGRDYINNGLTSKPGWIQPGIHPLRTGEGPTDLTPPSHPTGLSVR